MSESDVQLHDNPSDAIRTLDVTLMLSSSMLNAQQKYFL